MASKKRGGLSKREYAAKQAGGSLNYTTGKISTPAKKTTTTKSVAPLRGEGPLLPGQERLPYSTGPVQGPGLGYNNDYVQTNDAGEFQGISDKPQSSRSKVSSAIKSVLGKTAQASTDYSKVTPKSVKAPATGLVRALEVLADPLGIRNKLGGSMFSGLLQLRRPDLGITEALGLNKPDDGGLTNYVDENNQILGPQEQVAMYDYGQAKETNPALDVNQYMQDRAFRQENPYSPFVSAEAQRMATTRTPTPIKSARSIISDYNIPGTSPRSMAATVSTVAPSFPDFTPVSTGQPGTQRRFLGNGMLSNGMASNGKLDQGFDGASYGAPMTEEESLLREILGKTANAAEPQFNYSDSFSPMMAPVVNSAGPEFSQAYSPMMAPVNPTNEGDNPQLETNTQRGNGGVAQQYAQPSNPLVDYQKASVKGFDAQEKAQKRALKELLKSIRATYQTKTTEGKADLEKSRREDLFKLAGLFSFANQDPNSEQRIQYEQRANQDYADQVTKFLAQLSAAQAQEESGARQGYQSQVANIASQRNDAQYRIAQLLEQARQDAMNRTRGGSTSAGSITFIGNDNNGNPVYRNSKTGETQTYQGLKRPSASMTPQLQQDENGNWYYEV